MVTAFLRETRGPEHFVQFYESDTFLVESVSKFIGTGLIMGDVVIVLATKAHREGFDERLREDGLVVAVAYERGQYISMDAAATLPEIMVEGLPDARRFSGVIGSLIARAEQEGRSVRIYGELVALLWADGNRAGAIRLEDLWNELARTHSFSLFCGYPMQGFDREAYETEFARICTQHSRVIPTESYAQLSNLDECLRAITLLQQKVTALEVELAERRRAEEGLREKA